jgi:hypothetical protein
MVTEQIPEGFKMTKLGLLPEEWEVVRLEEIAQVRSGGSAPQGDIDWTYISPDDALNLRGGETGFVFKEIFVSQLQKLNDFLTQPLAEELIKRIEAIPPSIEGNLIAWEYLKGIKTVFVPVEKRERNVMFLDIKDINNNTFHVTDEFTFTSVITMVQHGIPQERGFSTGRMNSKAIMKYL